MIKPDWQTEDGSIRLYRGDCLEVMPELTETVDCICTDLPYGTTACKWDTVIPFAPLWEAYKRAIKPNGAIALFGSQPFTSALVMSNPKMFRYSLVWDKVNRYTGYGNANKMPLRRHEDIVVFYRSLPTFNKQFREGPRYRTFKGVDHGKHLGRSKLSARWGENDGLHHNPCSIVPFKGKVNSEQGKHPTQKPVALLEYLIRTYTNEGETVLDNCFGSGTTAVACINTGRRFIGVERDAHYFDVAVARIEAALGNVGLFAAPASPERSLSHG